MVSSSLLTKAFLSALKSIECDIPGYKSTTSGVTKMVFSGVKSRLWIFLMKSPESLI